MCTALENSWMKLMAVTLRDPCSIYSSSSRTNSLFTVIFKILRFASLLGSLRNSVKF